MEIPVKLESNGRPIEFVLDCSSDFTVDYVTACGLAQHGICEPEVVHVMSRFVRAGDTVVDVGANIGYHTMVLSRLVGDGGKVMAFEPIVENFQRLVGNAAVSKAGNVDPWCVALFDETRCLLFSVTEDSGGCSFLDYGDAIGHVVVKTRLLDDLIGEVPVRLMKVDCEGAELQVLRGAKKLLRRGVDAVIVELNYHTLKAQQLSERNVREYMGGLGYDCFLIFAYDGILPCYLPPKTRLYFKSTNFNVLFSTIAKVEAAWPELRF